MKTHRYTKTGILAAGALLLAGSARLEATTNFTVAAFATGTQGENNSQDGSNGQYNGNNLSVPYGAGTIAWDGITFDAADGSTGAAHLTANFSGADNTDILVSMAPGYNNWFFEGASASCPTGTVDFTQYHAVQFDVLWDTNSTLTIDQFNTGSNWPAGYLVGGVGSNYMATNSYYTHGVNVDLFTGSGGGNVGLGTFQIPANAATGWQTVTVPYSDAAAGISAGAGLWFQGSFGGGSGISGGPYKASFWIDKLVLVGNVTISPPPTLSISPAGPGLNLFTASGPALNNRESLETTHSNLTWVGASGPVSYSFSISSYPIPTADQVQNHIFLIPSPGTESSPDYNEPNVIYMDLESTGTGGAQWTFRYKTNQPNGNAMIYGAGALASIQNPTGTGTWKVTFNNNTNVTMTTPSGTSTNFSIPDSTGATAALFASNVVVYYGSQANNVAAENDHTITADFNVTGLGAANFDDNFAADAGVLNTNIWKINAAAAQCVRMVGPGSPYYVSWTLPASGFSLQATASLTAKNWLPTTSNQPFLAGNLQTQLISTNDLPAGKSAFFSLVQRSFSKLLVLLPGETAAPGTPTGKTGTPTQQDTTDLVNVTVNAVDSQFNPVAGINDTIQLSSSDGSAVLPNSAAMSNGTVTFSTFLFQTDGTQNITATDTTNTNIPPATSSNVVVAN